MGETQGRGGEGGEYASFRAALSRLDNVKLRCALPSSLNILVMLNVCDTSKQLRMRGRRKHTFPSKSSDITTDVMRTRSAHFEILVLDILSIGRLRYMSMAVSGLT